MILFFILAFFLVLVILYFVLFRAFVNEYKLIMIFGKKGSGKSTLLTKLAFKYHKKGWNIYSTENTPFSFSIRPEQVGFVQLKPRSVLLIDEVSLVWSNRDFKSFKREVEQFFRFQRKYKIRCYLFSQSFDIDKKLRDLTDEMYLMRNVFSVFSYGKRISKRIVLTEAEADRPSTISENLCFDSFFLFWCGSRFLTFIPRWTKYFESFNPPALKEVNFEYNELPKTLREKGSSSFLCSCFNCSRGVRFILRRFFS